MERFLLTAEEISAGVLASRGGRPFTDEELHDLLGDDEDEEECAETAPG